MERLVKKSESVVTVLKEALKHGCSVFVNSESKKCILSDVEEIKDFVKFNPSAMGKQNKESRYTNVI
jgi:hypothetical protein